MPTFRAFLFHCTLAATLLVQAVSAPAQTPAGDTLPLKNLLIEVRQSRSESSESSGVDLARAPALQQGSRSLEATALQTSLVLNGRSVRLQSGSSAPLRLVQSYLRNGAIVTLPQTVWIEAATGFLATPRWSGDAWVELSIDAQQGRVQGGSTERTQSSSQVLVPLNTWTTVAHSEGSQDERQSDLGQWRNRQTQGSFALQVRISLPQ